MVRGVVLVSATLVATVTESVSAQTLQGRVLDDADDAPIPTALVRLVDEEGDEQAITAADSSGAYRLVAPGPGVYRVAAERIGYDDLQTPLLEAQNADKVYPVDLLMRRSPVPIRGLEVSTEQADREIRLMIGISPRSLRVEPIRFPEIREHAERAHDLSDMIRWGNTAGLIVFETTDGPCYQARARGCLPVYLNGFRMNRELIPAIPLDMLHTVVVLYPTESIAYPGGAVLLYTEAWLR
jgi:hypothetical protein